jgi:transposase
MASQRMITIPEAEYLQMQHQIKWLEHQLAELKRLVFGSKSERFIAAEDPAQLNLFDLPSPEVVPVMQQEITYVRNKAESREGTHPLRAELAAHLPRKVEVIEPQDLPSGAKKIGEVITETLEYQPANVFVRQIQRPKYVVEQTDESTTIVIAPLPSLPIPKGNAGASMIAHILVSKFVDHLPYYRQSQIFKRQNLYISDSTIGGWANTAIHNWLVPVWETMKTKLLEADYLMADETPIPVLSEDKPGATHRGFYWVYYDPVNKRVIFDYQKTRGREGPKGFLKSFTGHLQTDGYSVYDQLAPAEKIKHLACFSHARRKYEHALQNDQQRATKALTWIQQLYDIIRSMTRSPYFFLSSSCDRLVVMIASFSCFSMLSISSAKAILRSPNLTDTSSTPTSSRVRIFFVKASSSLELISIMSNTDTTFLECSSNIAGRTYRASNDFPRPQSPYMNIPR